MPAYMLLLHQSPSKFRDLSPEEIQQIIARYKAWREQLVRQNRLRGTCPHLTDGRSASRGAHAASAADVAHHSSREAQHW